MKERLCGECGLEISICNAKAMLRIAVDRHGTAKVAAAVQELLPTISNEGPDP